MGVSGAKQQMPGEPEIVAINVTSGLHTRFSPKVMADIPA
jgi:hypothetical protein